MHQSPKPTRHSLLVLMLAAVAGMMVLQGCHFHRYHHEYVEYDEYDDHPRYGSHHN